MTVILEAPEAHRGIRNSRGVEFCAIVVEYDLFASWKNDFATDCAFAQRIETMVWSVIVVVMVVEGLERNIIMVLAEKYKKPSDGTGCRLEILLWLTNSVQRLWSLRGDPSNPADES